MTQITFVQQLIGDLDLHLPWLLPALESFEHTLPSSVRLLICTLLLAWLALRWQSEAESASNRLHRAVLQGARPGNGTRGRSVF